MWKLGICTILGAAALAALPISPSWSPTPSLSLDKANARIGHPLSPGSVAGVNRRVNRREARRDYYGYGAAGVAAGAAGIAAAGAGYYGGGLYDYAPGVYRRAARRAAYGYGAPAIVEDSGYEDAGYSGSGLYDYSPVAATTSAATTASSPVPLSPAEYASCMSRTFGAGPC